MNLERDKLYRTRRGEIRRVVAVDCVGDYPCLSVLIHGGQSSCAFFHRADGTSGDFDSPHDLVAEHREPREWWVRLEDTYQELGAFEGPWVRVREVLEETK